MVGAELHPATGSAIVVRQRARGEQRRRPAQTHLPPRTVVDLKRTKPDIPPTDIPPPRASILTCRRGVGIGLKRVGSKRIEPLENWAWGLSLIALTMAIHGTGVIFMPSRRSVSGFGWRARTASSCVGYSRSTSV